jgi:hypothetical protein
LTCPSEEDVDSGWQEQLLREAHRESTHCFCKHRKTGYHFK